MFDLRFIGCLVGDLIIDCLILCYSVYFFVILLIIVDSQFFENLFLVYYFFVIGIFRVNIFMCFEVFCEDCFGLICELFDLLVLCGIDLCGIDIDFIG